MQFLTDDSKILDLIKFDENKVTSEMNSTNEDKSKINNFEKIKYKLENLREKTLNTLTDFLNFINNLKDNFGKYLNLDSISAKKSLFQVTKPEENFDSENLQSMNIDAKIMELYDLT